MASICIKYAAYMPYSDICHIQVHICGYRKYMSLYIYGYTSEGVRELGWEVTGGARPKKFGDRCTIASMHIRGICLFLSPVSKK